MPFNTSQLANILVKISVFSIIMICGLLLYDLGWTIPNDYKTGLRLTYMTCLVLHLFSILNLLWLDKKRLYSKRQLIIQTLIAVSTLTVALYQREITDLEHLFSPKQINTVLTAALVCIPFFSSLSKVIAWITGEGRKTLPPALLFLITLTGLAFAGSLLLKMPNCTYEAGISYIDSLFVSTSAVCVTGLSTISPPDTFTPLGLVVLIILVQLGGLGIMSFAYFVAMILGQGFSLKDKVLIKDLMSEETLQSSTSFLKGIVIFTLTVELLGTLGLFISWYEARIHIPGDDPFIWHAAFHAISSFCNAGFSTFKDGMGTYFVAKNKASQTVIMLLIITGSFGYGIFKEMGAHLKRRWQSKKHHYNKLRWTTHFTLATKTSIILIFGGGLFIFIAVELLGTNLPWQEVMWDALFNSVSSRTAGIAISDLGVYPSVVALFMCGLMMIGGSPGGTAGGVRTTTFSVVIGEVWRILKERRDVEYNGRSIAREVVERSIAVVVISGAWVGTMTMISCFLEPNLEALDLFFENVSAFTTTGFTRGITPILNSSTKTLLIINMIAGRVGIFFFLVALVGRPSPKPYRYPSTKLPLN